MRFPALPWFARPGALLLVAGMLAACGGQTITQSATVTPNAPTAPSSASATSSTAYTIALPTLSSGQVSVAITLPTTNVAATVTAAISTAAPSGVTPLAAKRSVLSTLPSALAYVSFTTSTAVTLGAVPAFTFSLSQITAGDLYYLALDTPSGWEASFDGPATVSGTTLTFPSIAGSIALSPGAPTVFALYAVSASPSPNSTPVAAPNALSFDVNYPVAATFTVTETGNGEAFTSAIDCTENPAAQTPAADAFVAQVTPASATPATLGDSVTFTVTPGAETGTCAVTVSDVSNRTVTVQVTVSATGAIIFGTRRK